MQLPVQVTFRHLPVSDAIERECWEEAAKLERYYDRITSCRIVVDRPQHRHHQGNLYQVRIDLMVPGEEIVINREPPDHHQDEEFRVAVREAFDSARRKLEDYARRQRGQVKIHEPAPEGRVAKVFPESDYGFIETCDGRQLYFHRHSVLNDKFDSLVAGDRVVFAEEQGREGAQASTVRITR